MKVIVRIYLMNVIAASFAISIFLAGCAAQGESVSSSSREFLSTLDSAEVEQLESLASDRAEGSCAAFRVSAQDVLAHLRAAQLATARDYADDWYSPCKVGGVIRSATGEYPFFLLSSGVALLHNGEEMVFIFAEPAWVDPYAGSYQNRD